MPLKIVLKPGERVIIGGAVISNGKFKSELFVENKVPILRQKDILSFKEADTPCRRLYFSIQLMYMDEGRLAEHHKVYWQLVKDLLSATPSVLGLIDQISEQILNNHYYQALKLGKKLIDYEQEVLEYVSKPI
ncbi:MAG: flagellar protein FlbT [Deltaproteobacteria bacterium RBG_13_43_22]|nr:MAG: flagellar protein FlbT [Deltaproteobacteria bacterium RBG_13_43_22]